MTATASMVFVVDDDPSVRKSLTRLIGSAGYAVEAFASPGSSWRANGIPVRAAWCWTCGCLD
jgi:FixJ family two-component response regulator